MLEREIRHSNCGSARCATSSGASNSRSNSMAPSAPGDLLAETRPVSCISDIVFAGVAIGGKNCS